MYKRAIFFLIVICACPVFSQPLVSPENPSLPPSPSVSQKELTSYEHNKRLSLLKKAKEILDLNERAENPQSSSSWDPLVRNKILNQFIQVKEEILSDIQSGNASASIDIYLILDGFVGENQDSLKSLLSIMDQGQFQKNFASFINYYRAQKLSEALRENKNSAQIEFRLQKESKKTLKHCQFRVNGVLLSHAYSFYGPADIPFYVAYYCPNGTFQIKKVSARAAQPVYDVLWGDPQEITYDPRFKIKRIPQASASKEEEEESSSPLLSSAKQEPRSPMIGRTPLFFSTGLGYLQYEGNLKEQGIKNQHLPAGSFLFWSNLWGYPIVDVPALSVWVGLDMAGVNHVQTFQSASTENNEWVSTSSTQTFTGRYYKQSVGVGSVPFGKTSDGLIASQAGILLHYVHVGVGGDDAEPSYQASGFGIETQWGVRFGKEEGLFAKGMVILGYTAGDLAATSKGGVVSVGYSF